MTDENNFTFEASLSYEEYCRRLGSPGDADLMYTRDVLGRIGLEVLWLKVSLLSEMVRRCRTTRINLSQCQIKLVPSVTHLPLFWTFSIEPMPASVGASTQSVLRELGLCWFRTLLTNPGQMVVEVNSALTSLLTASAGNANVLIESAMRSPVLQSTQLFVAKTSSRANSIPADLWQRVLELGLKLLTQIPNFSYSSQAEDTLDTVISRVLTDVEALCARVATALFIDPPRMEQDLGELMNELIRDPRWFESAGALSAMPAARPAVLAQPELFSEIPPVNVMSEAAHEHDMESTIIIKRGSTMPSAPATSMPASAVSSTRAPLPVPATEENLEATIIISKDKQR